MEKDVEERLIQVCRSLIKMLELLFEAFKKLNEESVREAEGVKAELEKHSSELARFLIQKGAPSDRGSQWAKPFLSMASSFNRMGYNMEGIADRLNGMVKQHLLFSDKAVKEVNDVFQEAMDLLESLPDLLVTRNKLLARKIGEQVKSILKIADGYSEKHEERLIQGICVPKSSAIYLGLLESLKAIISHTLEIGGKIVSVSNPS